MMREQPINKIPKRDNGLAYLWRFANTILLLVLAGVR